MKKLMHILMLSCKKASELIDKKSFVKLTLKEKVMLRIHTSMCDACITYQKQSNAIDKILHEHVHHSDEKKMPIIENNELKELIISKL